MRHVLLAREFYPEPAVHEQLKKEQAIRVCNEL
jgi:hypothetical protein